MLFLLISLSFSTTFAQEPKLWEWKIGASGGMGVTDLRRTDLEISGPGFPIAFLPQKQLAESLIVNVYAEVLWREKWGISLGAEGNFIKLRQHIKAGNFLYIDASNLDWDQFTIPLLFSRSFGVGSLGHRLKLSIGPELSYYNYTKSTLKTFYQDEWLQHSYARRRQLNMGLRALCVWSSQVGQRSRLNLGLGMNYDMYGQIDYEAAFFFREGGVYSFDDVLAGSLPEEELVYRITHTIKPLQYFFVLQWVVSLKRLRQ
ncbi:MAG: hypothetical protein AAFR61_16990 [Bacteroidota bacterium]